MLLEGDFLKKVEKTSSCWIWRGGRQTDGYGSLWIKNKGKWKSWLAHRYAYSIFITKIPSGLCVLHQCDNRPCVNPEHLFLGTQKDNVIDMHKKGRHVGTSGRTGEKCAASKLTIKKVAQIRAMHSSGKLSQQEIGERFGVSQPCVSDVVLRKTWTNATR